MDLVREATVVHLSKLVDKLVAPTKLDQVYALALTALTDTSQAVQSATMGQLLSSVVLCARREDQLFDSATPGCALFPFILEKSKAAILVSSLLPYHLVNAHTVSSWSS